MYKRIATRQFKTAFQKPFSKVSCIVIILFLLYQLAQNYKFEITRKKSKIKKKRDLQNPYATAKHLT